MTGEVRDFHLMEDRWVSDGVLQTNDISTCASSYFPIREQSFWAWLIISFEDGCAAPPMKR